MRKRYGLGIIRTTSIISGILLLIILLGFIVANQNKYHDRTNYVITDQLEMAEFVQVLTQNNIPWEKLSETTLSIPNTYQEIVSKVFRQFIEDYKR